MKSAIANIGGDLVASFSGKVAVQCLGYIRTGDIEHLETGASS